MFGFSFGEVLILVLVAIIVVGPRQLPSMLRTAGQWIAKLRRMAFDMRSQSGIDQLLRDEGLERDIKELRRLLALRRGDLVSALGVDIGAELEATLDAPKDKARRAKGTSSRDDVVVLLTEYPSQGADAYGAVPEDVAPYMESASDGAVEQSDTRGAAKQATTAAAGGGDAAAEQSEPAQARPEQATDAAAVSEDRTE